MVNFCGGQVLTVVGGGQVLTVVGGGQVLTVGGGGQISVCLVVVHDDF